MSPTTSLATIREQTPEFLQQRDAAVELIMQSAEVWFGQPEDVTTDQHLFKVWTAALSRYVALLHVTIPNPTVRNRAFDRTITQLHESFAHYAHANDRMIAADEKAAAETRIQ